MLSPAELVSLIAAVAERDQDAFQRLYDATRAKLFGVVLRILRRQDLAEEVIQDAYVKIWNNAAQFDSTVASPITWMASIARNRAIDVARKRGEVSIEEEPSANDVAAETPDPLARREMTEELKRLLECIGRLEPDRQKLVLLAYYNGWSREQLGAKFGAPANTIKTWLRRSLLDVRGVFGTDLMAHSEDHSALAAEYALGTLDAAERAEAEALTRSDAEFAALVKAWELKLGALNQMVGLVEPRAEVWDRIKAAIAAESQRAVPPQAAPPIGDVANAGVLGAPGDPILPRPANDTGPAPSSASSELSPESKRVVHFAKRAYIWRGVAMLSSAVAASLLLVVGAQVYQPDLLPDGVRPPIRTKIVKVETPPPAVPAQYVAVLQKDGNAPAFILTVDAGSKTFTVRRVAATPEPGKSYELWIVSDKLQKPRSLGVIGNRDFTVNPVLSSYDPDLVSKATYAVTVEPEGGSPTGVATGPIVFTGKLVESVPQEPIPTTPRQ